MAKGRRSASASASDVVRAASEGKVSRGGPYRLFFADKSSALRLSARVLNASEWGFEALPPGHKTQQLAFEGERGGFALENVLSLEGRGRSGMC